MVIIGCDSSRIDMAGISMEIIDSSEVIDVSDALGQKKLIEDIVSDVSIVQLETKEESILSYIYQVELAGNYIYIRDDYDGGNVAIFDKNGKFIKRLPHGSGPQEVDNAFAMYFDSESSCLYVYDDTAEKIVKYSSTGEYINTYYCDMILSGLAIENGKFLFVQEGMQSSTGNFVLTEIDTTSHVSKELFLGNGHFVYLSKYIQKCDEGCLITIPWGNVIFRCHNGKVLKKYIVKNINTEDLDYSKYGDDFEMRGSLSSDALVFDGSCIETKNYHIFGFVGQTYSSYKHFIRNKKLKDWYEVSYSTLLYSFIRKVSVFDYDHDCFVGILLPECLMNEQSPQSSYDFSNPHNLISSEDMAKLKSVKPDDNPLVITYRLKFDK